MSRIKHPGEKKRLSLSGDHRVHARHGTKSLRSKWRAKKARTNREFRHAGKGALAAIVADEACDAPLDTARVSMKPKRFLKKESVESLADWIVSRKKYRAWSKKELPPLVPDEKTAMSLARIVWKAAHPVANSDQVRWRNIRAWSAHFPHTWIVGEHWDRVMFGISRSDGGFERGNLISLPANRAPPPIVPDGKTAISLARIVWQATQPGRKRTEGDWQHDFQATAFKDIWIVSERKGRRQLFISKQDGGFLRLEP